MPTTPASLPTRDDTLLGVCEGLGEEFGIGPTWLRVALGASVLWNPLATIAGYLVLGLILMTARWLAPVPAAAVPAGTAVAANDPTERELSLAA